MATETFSVRQTKQIQGGLWTFAPWLSRLVMLPPILVLTLISIRFLTNTGHAIPGAMLTTPEAFTDTRVMAAWMMTMLAMLLLFVSSQKRLWLGHLQIALLMGLVLVVRIFGFAHDGTTLAMGNQKPITVAEIVFLTLNLLGLFLQNRVLKQTGVAQ